MPSEHDLVVIGGGPAGYVAAIRAAQLGMNVGCIEKESFLGGTCLRVGCIPSKALLESTERFHEIQHSAAEHGIKVGDVSFDLAVLMKRKEGIVSGLAKGIDDLLRKRKIARYLGLGKIVGPNKLVVDRNGEKTEITAKRILIATGSKSANLPGIQPDGDRIGFSTEALSYPSVPGHLVVIGAGAIGLELGSVWGRLGAKVSVLEYLDRILPEMDGEIANQAKRVFQKQGMEFHLSTRVTGARRDGDGCIVEREGAEPIRCDRVLVSVGRVPYTEGLGLDSVGVEVNKRGQIPVNEHYQTNVKDIYAIGDVIPGPMLAHKAEEEGVAVVEYLATGYGHVNYDAIPAVVYTHPEVASVGKSEERLQKDGIAYKKGAYPYRGNGRARVIGAIDGMVKILADAKTDRVLGVHILGAHAGDLIAEAVFAMETCASSEDIARTSHAHPSLAEIIKEAAFAVADRAIHY